MLRESASSDMPDGLILLTGGTGLIGRHVLAKMLADDEEQQFAVLTRGSIERLDVCGGRVWPVLGDLRSANLGLSESVLSELCMRVSGIVHCAAEIRFDLPLEEAREINVAGTRRVLHLARRCAHLDRFAHIGTTYVAGRSEKPLPEARFVNEHGFFSSYQESKYEAEQLVLDQCGELPVSVYRLSTVIGDSQTGRVEQYNYFHQLIRLARHNTLAVLPGSAEAQVDVVATDWVTSAIVCLFSRHFEPGVVRNLCAGPANGIAVKELLTRVFERFEGSGKYPALVSGPEFARYIEVRSKKAGGNRLRQLLQTLAHFLPYLSIRQHFENEGTLALLRQVGQLQPVDSRLLLERVLLNACW